LTGSLPEEVCNIKSENACKINSCIYPVQRCTSQCRVLS
jgi:hypothetical protein